MREMISKDNIRKIKNCFSKGPVNLNQIRASLNIRRGNNTLRDFVMGTSDEPGYMALLKMTEYSNMDLMVIPVKRLDRLDNQSRQDEQQILNLINERFTEVSINLNNLVTKYPQKVSKQKLKKEDKKKLQNSTLIQESLMSNQNDTNSEFIDNTEDLFGEDITLSVGAAPSEY